MQYIKNGQNLLLLFIVQAVATGLNFGGKGYSMKRCCYWIFKAFMCTENWMLSLCKCVDFRPGTITKTNHKEKVPKVKVKSFLPYPRIELGTSGLALQCSTNWANRVMLISLCFLDLLNVAERGWVCIAWLAIGCLFVRTSLNFGGKGYSMNDFWYWIFKAFMCT